MPTPLDHVVVFLFAVALPIEGSLSYPRFVARVRRGEPGVRLRQFRLTAIVQWAIAALALFAWLYAGRNLADLGLGLPLDWRAIVAWVVCLVLATLYARQLATIRRSPEALDGLEPQLRPVADLMPHDPEERRAFVIVACTAGICEELLFRGFFLWYLGNWMPLWAAVLIATGVFGAAHAYQGVHGIVKTGLVGLLMMLLYVLGRTLWPLMVLHAVVDVAGGLMGYEFVRRTARARGFTER